MSFNFPFSFFLFRELLLICNYFWATAVFQQSALATASVVVNNSICSWGFLKEVSSICLIMLQQQNKENFHGNQMVTGLPPSLSFPYFM